ncbi:MAG: UDP-2,3-diacylglucosamine hydrolase [Proteobacteria bacterium]|nr:MAG: UDP-2,3-diacylglucosamine hydrolase [Pseudomonadota bacterium]
MRVWDCQKLVMPPKIKDGAIFIADAHENEKRGFLWEFLCEIERENIKPSSLFLMGDMFDLLVGQIQSTHGFAREYIQKLDHISQEIPVYYFEGNHDFNLKTLFSNVKVFSIQDQPAIFQSKAGNILLSHGDSYEDIKYKIYTFLIRNNFICKALNLINEISNHIFCNKIISHQHTKNICKKIDNFQEKISLKLPKYNLENTKAIIEGHYHQNQSFMYKNILYFNLASFACSKSYFVANFSDGISFDEIKFKV